MWFLKLLLFWFVICIVMMVFDAWADHTGFGGGGLF